MHTHPNNTSAACMIGMLAYDNHASPSLPVLSSMHVPGMPAYRPPPREHLPVDLNAGYPESYVRKPEGDGESTPVEVIIQGARHTGLDARTMQVVTFRLVWGWEGGPGGGTLCALMCTACCFTLSYSDLHLWVGTFGLADDYRGGRTGLWEGC